MEAKKDIKEIVLSEYKKGNIVVSTFDGLKYMPIEEIIKQPASGLLYDLNRDEGTILTFIDDPKWVNDYAVSQVIRLLKKKSEEREYDIKCKSSRPHFIEGCICQYCGNKYKIDLLIPDELWEQIKPSGKPQGTGLLCGLCIISKLENLLSYSAFKIIKI